MSYNTEPTNEAEGKKRQILTLENASGEMRSWTADRWIKVEEKDRWIGISITPDGRLEISTVIAGMSANFLVSVEYNRVAVEKLIALVGANDEMSQKSIWEMYMSLCNGTYAFPGSGLEELTSYSTKKLANDETATVLFISDHPIARATRWTFVREKRKVIGLTIVNDNTLSITTVQNGFIGYCQITNFEPEAITAAKAIIEDSSGDDTMFEKLCSNYLRLTSSALMTYATPVIPPEVDENTADDTPGDEEIPEDSPPTTIN